MNDFDSREAEKETTYHNPGGNFYFDNFFIWRFFMKNRKKLPLAKLPFMFTAIMVVGLLASLSVSCASTGNFMPVSQGETVIETIQASFTTRNTLNGRDAINTQSYIKLLEAAQGRYGRDTAIDIRDIVWVSGQAADNQNTEYSATGKVIQVP
jgi:hypothetical protein